MQKIKLNINQGRKLSQLLKHANVAVTWHGKTKYLLDAKNISQVLVDCHSVDRHSNREFVRRVLN